MPGRPRFGLALSNLGEMHLYGRMGGGAVDEDVALNYYQAAVASSSKLWGKEGGGGASGGGEGVGEDERAMSNVRALPRHIADVAGTGLGDSMLLLFCMHVRLRCRWRREKRAKEERERRRRRRWNLQCQNMYVTCTHVIWTHKHKYMPAVVCLGRVPMLSLFPVLPACLPPSPSPSLLPLSLSLSHSLHLFDLDNMIG